MIRVSGNLLVRSRKKSKILLNLRNYITINNYAIGKLFSMRLEPFILHS